MNAKFNVEKQEIAKSLSHLKPLYTHNQENISFSKVTIIADGKILFLEGTDGDNIMRSKCNYNGDSFIISTPFMTLNKVMSICEGVINFTIFDEKIVLKTANSENIIPVYKGEEFSTQLNLTNPLIQINVASNFVDSLLKAPIFCSNDPMRESLNNVCIDIKKSGISVVSSDAHVLFYDQYEIVNQKELKIIVQKKSLKFLSSNNSLLQIYENFLKFNMGDFEIISKIDMLNKYPDYEKTLPKEDEIIGEFKFEKGALIEAINKMNIVRFDNSLRTKFEITGNTLYISSIDNDKQISFRTWIPISGNGAHFSFYLITTFLLKALTNLDSDNISMCFYNQDKMIGLRVGYCTIYVMLSK